MKNVLLLWCVLLCQFAQAQQIIPQPFNTYFDIQDSEPNRPKLTVARQVFTDSDAIYCFGNTLGADSIGINLYHVNGSFGIAKYAYDGSLLWKRWYQSPGYFNSIGNQYNVLENSNGFVIVGVDADTAVRDSAFAYQPFLFWVDKNGDSLRLVKHVDSLHDRTIQCATFAPDKSILAAGVWSSATRHYSPYSQQYEPDSNSMYLVKYDSVGSILWEKTLYPTSQFPVNPLKIALTVDGGILVCGFAASGIVSSFGNFFAKFDSVGNFLWSRRYAYDNWYPTITNGPDLIPLPDGGYYFSYMANTKPIVNAPTPPVNGFFSWGRADAQGDTLWVRRHADTLNGGFRYSMPTRLSMDENHNLYIQGHVLDSGNMLPRVITTDSNGRIKSIRDYKAVSQLVGNHFMAQTVRSPYNTFVHFGSIQFNQLVPGVIDTLGTYGWLMQTDSFGCMQPGCKIADSVWHYNPTAVVTTNAYEQVVLYPNPASHSITLEGVPQGSRYEIVDMKGTNAGSGIIQEPRAVLHVETLVPGVYIIRIHVGNKPPVQLRLIKQ